MLMILQAETPPPLPWWVLYAVVLGFTWGTWRMAKSRWWKGCLTAAAGWVVVLVTAVLTLPADRLGVIAVVMLAPLIGWAMAMLSGRRAPGAGPAFAPPRRFTMSRETMQGQPSARSVLRSKLMGARFAAGMPRDSAYVARVAHVSGAEGVDARPVDLFVGGGSLWVAPLVAGAAPVPIPLRDVLRADVWPEGDAPPTLRVSWSPRAGEMTRELVLAAIAEVPPALVGRQLGAIAGAVTDAMEHDERAVLSAGSTPSPVVAVVPAEICPRCGTAFADGARRCAQCGFERPHA